MNDSVSRDLKHIVSIGENNIERDASRRNRARIGKVVS